MYLLLCVFNNLQEALRHQCAGVRATDRKQPKGRQGKIREILENPKMYGRERNELQMESPLREQVDLNLNKLGKGWIT